MKAFSRSPFARTDGRPRIPQLPASIVLQGRSLVGETVTDDLRIKSLTVDEKDDATPAIRINRSNASPNSMEIYNSAGTLVAKLTAPGGLTTISAVSIFNAIADANPEFQVSHANLSLGAGGATTTDVQLGRAAADVLRLGAGGTTGDAFEFWEMTAPATPSGNAVRVYASDKAGVSNLYAKDDAGVEHDLFAVGGPPGAQGIQGQPGIPGDEGDEGAQGPPGFPGPTGATGSSGAQGVSGPPGLPGEDADDPLIVPGGQGIQGIQGLQGVPGIPGDDGDDGMVGIQGPAGAPGPAGPEGPSASRPPFTTSTFVPSEPPWASGIGV